MFGIANLIPGFSWIKMVAFAAVALVVFFGYLYVKGLQENNERLINDNAQLKVAVDLARESLEDAHDAIDEWETARERDQADRQHFAEVRRRARELRDELETLFSEHDFTNLSQSRPDLIEPRVDAGADRVRRMFRCETGGSGPDCGEDETPSEGVRRPRSRPD